MGSGYGFIHSACVCKRGERSRFVISLGVLDSCTESVLSRRSSIGIRIYAILGFDFVCLCRAACVINFLRTGVCVYGLRALATNHSMHFSWSCWLLFGYVKLPMDNGLAAMLVHRLRF